MFLPPLLPDNIDRMGLAGDIIGKLNTVEPPTLLGVMGRGPGDAA